MTKRWIAMALLLAGCAALFLLQRKKASVPITPRPLLYLLADTQREAQRIPLRLTRVSDEQEQKVGERIAREYGLTRAHVPDADSARITAYLNLVGWRVASHVRRKRIRYRFYLQDHPHFVNAFALPGGQIVVGRGLLELMRSEDELAAVLGHEIAHVDNRDAIERLQYELASRKLGLVHLYSLGEPLIQLFQAGYTKDQELEADRAGLGFAVAAGYSPAGAIDLMKRFEKLERGSSEHAGSPIREFAEVPFSALVEYFRSHPPAAERLALLEKEIRANGWNASQAVRALEIRPIFLTDAGERLNGNGDFRDSIAKLKEAVAIDARYARAWQALGNASWRSGDAQGTVQAETQVAQQGRATNRDWERLARGLAVADPKNATERLEQVMETPGAKASAGLFAPRIELDGLRFLRGEKGAAADFEQSLAAMRNLSAVASARRDMAWWAYRAGQLKAAEQELEQARQMLPQSPRTGLELVWVLTDLGRQADATETLEHISAEPYAKERRAEIAAGWAVLQWRTEQREQAKQEFRAAADADPVWMVAGWVRNNYSVSTTRVISHLQAFEAQRRAKAAGGLRPPLQGPSDGERARARASLRKTRRQGPAARL